MTLPLVTASLSLGHIRVRGQWRYLYRAVDKTGLTIDFLLTEQRDEHAVTCFLTKAIRRHGVPDKITIDGSEANAAAIQSYNQEHGTAIIFPCDQRRQPRTSPCGRTSTLTSSGHRHPEQRQ
jgi:transposase-like protein